MFNVYEVGGCVRDRIMGIEPHDIDFAVETTSFEHMAFVLDELGFEVFVSTPEYLTLRARFPKTITVEWIKPEYIGMTADFVLARRDGYYSDGRRPDSVEMGTIYDDLGRRDFTANAMAMEVLTDKLLDPFDGQRSIRRMELTCVGSAGARFEEDALRAIRAIRFKITKGFSFDLELQLTLYSDWLAPLLAQVDSNRRREELLRCFRANNLEALTTLMDYLSPKSLKALFEGGLWLKPTLEK